MGKLSLLNTVTGLVDRDQLGKILAHEHLSCDMSFCYQEPPRNMPWINDEISLKNYGYIGYYPYCNKSNLKFNGPEVRVQITKDLNEFMKHGGKTIVEASSYGCNRNIFEIVHYAKQNLMNIIVGTGYYAAYAQSESVRKMKTQQIHRVMLEDLEIGLQDYRHAKAGFIGEIGCGWPLHSFEKSMIAAASMTSDYNSWPVMIRLPGHSQDEAPHEIMRIFTEAGGSSTKVMLCHIENSFENKRELMSFVSEYRCYCQLDMYPPECSFLRFPNNVDELYTLDAFSCISEMIENGYKDYIILSNDIHTKHRLTGYGGNGYANIQKFVIPMLKQVIPIDESVQYLLESENARNWLTKR